MGNPLPPGRVREGRRQGEGAGHLPSSASEGGVSLLAESNHGASPTRPPGMAAAPTTFSTLDSLLVWATPHKHIHTQPAILYSLKCVQSGITRPVDYYYRYVVKYPL